MAFFLTAFSPRDTAAVVRARPRRPGLALSGRRASGPRRPQPSRTEHAGGLRWPGPARPGFPFRRA